VATSGSKNYTVNRTDLIESALRKLGAYDAGDTPSSDELADANAALNLMIKAWITKGLNVPWRETLTLFLQPDTRSYRIGPSGDECTESFVETTLSAAAITGATTITLTSTSGITASDRIGIKLDDGTIHWTTVVVAATTSITTGLASAAASGNAVYAYTTKCNRPVKLVYAHTRDSSGIDNEVDLIGETAYRMLSNKGSGGRPNQVYYQPTIDNGTLFVWPANSGGVDKLVLISQPYVDDFDAASDNLDFPIEWGKAIIFGLADDLGPEYGIPTKFQDRLERKAARLLEDLLDHDVENASLIIGAEHR